MDSLEDNFLYALMGKSNLMLYPYITIVECQYCDRGQEYRYKLHANTIVQRRVVTEIKKMESFSKRDWKALLQYIYELVQNKIYTIGREYRVGALP